MRLSDGDDDEPLRLPRPPRPRGWFEVFCCGAIVVLLFGVLVIVAALQR